VTAPITSFVHDELVRQGQLADYTDNRPRAVRCVHPLVTLVEKLDALSRKYARDIIEPDGFVRHYEDAAHIIQAASKLPTIEQSARALAEDMLREKDIVALPRPEEPALVLDDAGRRADIERASERIAPMFWGNRIPLNQNCRGFGVVEGRLRRVHIAAIIDQPREAWMKQVASNVTDGVDGFLKRAPADAQSKSEFLRGALDQEPSRGVPESNHTAQ
jgi:hypothetical protein